MAFTVTNGKWNDQNAGPIRAFGWPLAVQAGGLAQLSDARLQLTTAAIDSRCHLCMLSSTATSTPCHFFMPASEVTRVALWRKARAAKKASGTSFPCAPATR